MYVSSSISEWRGGRCEEGSEKSKEWHQDRKSPDSVCPTLWEHNFSKYLRQNFEPTTLYSSLCLNFLVHETATAPTLWGLSVSGHMCTQNRTQDSIWYTPPPHPTLQDQSGILKSGTKDDRGVTGRKGKSTKSLGKFPKKHSLHSQNVLHYLWKLKDQKGIRFSTLSSKV